MFNIRLKNFPFAFCRDRRGHPRQTRSDAARKKQCLFQFSVVGEVQENPHKQVCLSKGDHYLRSSLFPFRFPIPKGFPQFIYSLHLFKSSCFLMSEELDHKLFQCVAARKILLIDAYQRRFSSATFQKIHQNLQKNLKIFS